MEIGCGEGLLLKELSRSGFNVQGIEPSVTASSRARKKGLNVITGYFPDCLSDALFDVVILSHVLEHFADPIVTLELVSRVAPKGYLLLIQTNYKGLIPRWDREKWYAWSPHEHFWHFTPKGLQMIARRLGFCPIACEYSSLIHGSKRIAKLTGKIARVFPPAWDQFHLLLKRN
jgi:2-polyprenyl-3-methyl-5-hydroxy-6-metoxy-1,4-benzoquinol methylase